MFNLTWFSAGTIKPFYKKKVGLLLAGCVLLYEKDKVTRESAILLSNVLYVDTITKQWRKEAIVEIIFLTAASLAGKLSP